MLYPQQSHIENWNVKYLNELWKGRKPTVKYFHIFGSKCYILADREPRRKLDPKSEEGIFLGYSTNSRAFRVFNSRTNTVMESINVVVEDTHSTKKPDADENVDPYTAPSVSLKDEADIDKIE